MAGLIIALIIASMMLGAARWHMGLLIMGNTQKRHGCFDYCEWCGKPIQKPLASVLRRDK